MDNVNIIIEKGLSLLRDKYVSLSTIVSPNLEVTALEAAKMTSSFNWDKFLRILVSERMTLAYTRYLECHTQARACPARRRRAVSSI